MVVHCSRCRRCQLHTCVGNELRIVAINLVVAIVTIVSSALLGLLIHIELFVIVIQLFKFEGVVIHEGSMEVQRRPPELLGRGGIYQRFLLLQLPLIFFSSRLLLLLARRKV